MPALPPAPPPDSALSPPPSSILRERAARSEESRGRRCPTPRRPHRPPTPRPPLSPPRLGSQGRPHPSPPGPGSRGQRRSPGGVLPRRPTGQGWGRLGRPRVSGWKRGKRQAGDRGGPGRARRCWWEPLGEGARAGERGGRRGRSAGRPRENWRWPRGVPARCWRRRAGWAPASPPNSHQSGHGEPSIQRRPHRPIPTGTCGDKQPADV